MREETSSKETLRSVTAGEVAIPDQSEVSHMIYTYGLFGQIIMIINMFVQCSTSDIAYLLQLFLFNVHLALAFPPPLMKNLSTMDSMITVLKPTLRKNGLTHPN